MRLLATGAPQGLRESKRILNRDLVARIDEHGEEMAALSARLFASDEAREAMTAFLTRQEVARGRRPGTSSSSEPRGRAEAGLCRLAGGSSAGEASSEGNSR